MSRNPWRRACPCIALACLIGIIPSLALADVVFDDDFDGNSGGIPANWFGDGEGSAVEQGTTVTLHDNFTIGTAVDLDPNASAVTTIITAIEATTGHTHSGIIDFSQFDNHFWVKLWASDGRIEVKASDVASGEEAIDVGHVAGYSGGPIVLTLVLEDLWFSITTDSPAFSSGPIAYDTVFTSFTRDDLGHAAKLILESECSPGGPPCSSSYDRMTMEVGQSTPVRAVDWSAIKASFRR